MATAAISHPMPFPTTLRPYLPDCDLIVGTEEEVLIASGEDDLLQRSEDRFALISNGTIVLKRGPMGCIVYEGRDLRRSGRWHCRQGLSRSKCSTFLERVTPSCPACCADGSGRRVIWQLPQHGQMPAAHLPFRGLLCAHRIFPNLRRAAIFSRTWQQEKHPCSCARTRPSTMFIGQPRVGAKFLQ